MTAEAIAYTATLADPASRWPRPAEPYALSFDFDGTLADSKGRHWAADPQVDVTPVLQAFQRGYVAYVLTVNDTAKVARVLRKNGIDAIADTGWHREHYWHGGSDGRLVLVTNRKLKARAYIDDRALYWRIGDDPALIWAGIGRRHGSKKHGRKRAPGQAPWWRRALRIARHAAYVLTIGEAWYETGNRL